MSVHINFTWSTNLGTLGTQTPDPYTGGTKPERYMQDIFMQKSCYTLVIEKEFRMSVHIKNLGHL